MLRKVESTSDVNRGPEPCQSGTALTFPVLCLAYTRVVSQIDGAVQAYAHAHAHDDHYLTRSKFNSLLTEMITPQTYIYIYIYTYKTASCTSCIRGSLRLAPKYRVETSIPDILETAEITWYGTSIVYRGKKKVL